MKTGEFFALKHLINLDSDLLDVPDFYWDRPELEKIYQKVNSYLILFLSLWQLEQHSFEAKLDSGKEPPEPSLTLSSTLLYVTF